MLTVIELQTSADGTTAHVVTTHQTMAEAESKFHSVLAAAAVSAVPLHAAALLSEDGRSLRSEFYKHTEDA